MQINIKYKNSNKNNISMMFKWGINYNISVDGATSTWRRLIRITPSFSCFVESLSFPAVPVLRSRSSPDNGLVSVPVLRSRSSPNNSLVAVLVHGLLSNQFHKRKKENDLILSSPRFEPTTFLIHDLIRKKTWRIRPLDHRGRLHIIISNKLYLK